MAVDVRGASTFKTTIQVICLVDAEYDCTSCANLRIEPSVVKKKKKLLERTVVIVRFDISNYPRYMCRWANEAIQLNPYPYL